MREGQRFRPAQRPADVLFSVLPYLAPDEIGSAIDAMIERLDRLGGDPDLEDGHDAEDDQEKGDVAWAEWTPRQRGVLATGRGTEDDEDDDPRDASWSEGEHGAWSMANGAALDDDAEEDDAPGCLYAEDDFDLVTANDPGAGCPLADAGEWDGRRYVGGYRFAVHGFDQSVILEPSGMPFPGAANDS